MTHFNIYLILLSILLAIFIANTSLSNNNKIIISILNVIYLVYKIVIYLIYKIIGNKKNNNSLKELYVGSMVKFKSDNTTSDTITSDTITKYTITKPRLTRSPSTYGNDALEFEPVYDEMYTVISNYTDERNIIRENVWNIKRFGSPNAIMGFVLVEENNSYYVCITQTGFVNEPVEIEILN